MVQGELRLGEVVVGFHVAAFELDRFEAVVDACVVGKEIEAGEGAVGEDFGVRGVFLYAAPFVQYGDRRL